MIPKGVFVMMQDTGHIIQYQKKPCSIGFESIHSIEVVCFRAYEQNKNISLTFVLQNKPSSEKVYLFKKRKMRFLTLSSYDPHSIHDMDCENEG